MRTKVTPIEELKALFFESVINNTTKVTKIGKTSTLNGIGYGVAKVAQKALKEIAVNEARKFPRYASGSYLDAIADDYGIAARFGASGSSVYICIAGAVGTAYTVVSNIFYGNHGVRFDLEDDVTIPDVGYIYAKARSQTDGVETSIDPYTIVDVTNEPVGHQFCINEYKAVGGRDVEDDESFLYRIIGGANILATNTLSALANALMNTNSNVLRAVNLGVSETGKLRVGILSQNGIDFTQPELDAMLEATADYFAWSDISLHGGTSYAVVYENVEWYEFDIDFRCKILANYTSDIVRRELQIKISKLYDFRFEYLIAVLFLYIASNPSISAKIC